MDHLRARVAQLAPSDLRVQVCGETGTGKELVAKALHALSSRRHGPFVPVNAAGFNDELFTAELFGHARGAFTGAATAREGYVARAEGGTLFIDEVADLSPLAQVRLLRFLQEREYQRLGETVTRRADVRVISATNVELERRVSEGRFREDLLFRLRDSRLEVPPLRERGCDVLVLAAVFLARYASAAGRVAPWLGQQAEGALLRYGWPGNVRELEAHMRQLVVFVPGREVRLEDLEPEVQGPLPLPGGGLRAALRERELQIVRLALERHGGVQARAAAELGISRQALFAKLRRFGKLRNS
jgi:two-component system response regulator HydG